MPREVFSVPPRHESPQTLLARWLVAGLVGKNDTTGWDNPKVVRASREDKDGAILVRTERGETYIVTVAGPF